MIDKCTDMVVDWLINCKTIENEDRELYKYAVYSLFLTLSPLIISMIIGLCVGSILQSIIIVIPFMVIRKFSGGYHTKHLLSCLICSCSLLIICNLLPVYITCSWQYLLASIIASISLMIFSPLDNENRKLNSQEKYNYKRVTIFLTLIFMIINVVLFISKLKIYSICISIGIILSAALQLPCIIVKVIETIKTTKKLHKMLFHAK